MAILDNPVASGHAAPRANAGGRAGARERRFCILQGAALQRAKTRLGVRGRKARIAASLDALRRFGALSAADLLA